MSYTTDVYEELLALPIGKTCCRKALLFGMFYHAQCGENASVSALFRAENVATLAAELLKKQFNTESRVEVRTRVGKQIWVLETRSKALAAFLGRIDGEEEQPFFELVGFRCAECTGVFLRGIFFAAAALTDPHKGYHAEFLIASERRAERLRLFLTDAVARPGRIARKHGIGLYYKSNGALADLLYLIGASEASFDLANICIERDIRNHENRATNCVTSNISKAVEASRRHLAAINFLEWMHRFDSLSEELRHTAELRREYPSASLTELSRLHQPPITKSGLNRRLTCILQAAKDAGWEEE